MSSQRFIHRLARYPIKVDRILQHWEDFIRVAASLKLRIVHATQAMQMFKGGSRASSLAKALAELGRIIKTLYLLKYIDDETYRRRILIQLNRGEGRHALARRICYGQRGELRQRYREGQENQLGTLGFVTNAVVLWNTIYLDAAVKQLREGRLSIEEADLARLSPLGHAHITMEGHYQFNLADSVRRGELRGLRTPRLTDPLKMAFR